MPIEKGPEWDYVTLVQHEGTDGVKQGKITFPGCGVAECTAAEDTWVVVDEEGGQQEEGASSDGEGWFTGGARKIKF
eukprot:1161446-Pelagomonas_calceolata.AAC.1